MADFQLVDRPPESLELLSFLDFILHEDTDQNTHTEHICCIIFVYIKYDLYCGVILSDKYFVKTKTTTKKTSDKTLYLYIHVAIIDFEILVFIFKLY